MYFFEHFKDTYVMLNICIFEEIKVSYILYYKVNEAWGISTHEP